MTRWPTSPLRRRPSGKEQFTARHQGATYRFASAANRDTFVANPAKYAPAYGGFYAMGVVFEKLDVDPQAWRVVMASST